MMMPSRKLLVAALLAILGAVCPVKALTYEAWIAGYGLSGDDALPLSDPDGDGVVNLIEFAFAGQDPTVAQAPPTQRIVWGQRTGNQLPHLDPSAITEVPLNVVVTLAEVHVGVEWTPRADIEGVRWSPEYSRIQSGLYSWYSGRNAVVITDGAAGKKIAWSLELTPRNLLDRFFWRIRVKTIDP